MPVTNAEVRKKSGKKSVTQTLKFFVNLALVGLLIWFLASHQRTISAKVGSRDSVEYWSAGKLLVHHGNPYSVPDVLALERSAGYRSDRPLMFRCPPWAVWITLPVAFLSAYWAWVTWLAILLVSLVVSMRIAWRMYGNGWDPPSVFLVAGYLFAPVPACLVAGQLGLVLLIGIMLFFLLEEDYPFLAGASLLIPLAKPHMFSFLWPILAIWVVMRRKWSLMGGFAIAFVFATLIAFAFDPSIILHYREMLHQQAIQHEFIPGLSGMLRMIFFRRFFWVQFIPMGIGLLWSVRYYWTNREAWSWRQHGPAILVAAVLTTPYSWITDEAVLLPAILQGVLWLYRTKLTPRSQLVVIVFVLLDLLLLLILKAQVPFATGIYFWSSLVWFSWYWYAGRFREIPDTEKVALPVNA